MFQEHSNVLMISAFGLLCIILRFFAENTSIVERTFLTVFAGCVIFYLYTLHSNLGKNEMAIESKIGDLIDYVNHRNLNVLKFFLKNDKDLLNAFRSMYDVLDKGDKETLDTLLRLTNKFYRSYAKLLKDSTHNLKSETEVLNLIDLRLELLKQLHFVYSKYLQIDHSRLETSILAIQAATYKCINVIKHKYHDKDHLAILPPYASNMNESSFEIP